MATAALVAQIVSLLANTGVQIYQLIKIRELLENITNGAWLLEQARKWGFYFDKILINYADKIYGYFQEIVGGVLINSEITNGLMENIQVIVGIFIIFKLSIVSIKYMVNPEQFLDDKLGAQTLVKRVILGSIIIMFIPTIFNTAFELQSYVIKDRVIEKIILPKDAYLAITSTNRPGNELAMTVFKGFFSWNNNISEEFNVSVFSSYEKAIRTYNDIRFFPESFINVQSGNQYLMSYVPIISTLAVGCLLVMLIKYSMEVLFRSFKLLFMQILSPFVIVNYMLDPSQEDVMKKWVNATVSTYLLIFIRTFTLWFGTLICYYLTNGVDGASLLNTTDPLLKALIILGLFAFLKDLPKVVSEIFGYNLQENETIGGIVNQGIGIVKGFALAKVGMDFQKKQMGYNIASTALGATSNIAGGVSNSIQGFKAGDLTKGQAWTKGIGTVGAGFSAGASGITANMGQVLSSGMGSTVLSPIAQAGSVAASADRGVKPDVPYARYEHTGDRLSVVNKLDNKIENQHSSEYNNFVDAASELFKEGDSIDLTTTNNTDIEGNTINVNPIVQQMTDYVNERLSENNYGAYSPNREALTHRMYQTIDDSHFDKTKAKPDDLANVMDQVYKSVSSAISDATKNAINSANAHIPVVPSVDDKIKNSNVDME